MKLIDILKEAINPKYPSTNFQLLSKKKEKKQFGSGYNMNYEFLINDEDYTTSSGLKFNIKTIGYISTNINNKPDFDSFFYIQTDVYHNGKSLTGPSGIPGKKGYGFYYDVAGSVNKAKKWLEANGEKLIQGKEYQYKST
jgi:hypothetical protein